MRRTIVQTLAICYLMIVPAINSIAGITGTYVDADITNTISENANWLETPTNLGNNGQWSYSAQGAHVEGLKAFVSFVPNEDCPKITTTISDLPCATYDVYVVYWTFPNGQQWRIQAGLHNQPTQICDWSTGMICRNDGLFQERQVKLGRLPNITSFSVDIDDAPGLAGDQRAMYDGIAYLNVAEIAGSITGTISQPDFENDLSKWPIYIELAKNGKIEISTVIFTDSDGAFTLSGVSPGDYDMTFQACKALRKVVSVEVLAEQTSCIEVSLLNGDIDGDNEISSTDLSILGLNLGFVGD